MQKVSYMGNGTIKEFCFNFPYFENSNIIVTKNNAAATGYNIIGTTGGLDADIPYTGGKVVFETAPTALDCITIARQLPLTRIVDYQPTVKIDPTTLNQDLNYLMEVIKDRKDELEDLTTKYAEIADKESTTTLLARISTIHDEIVTIDAKITALGDISQIRGDITTLNNRTTGLLDYVIESQSPSAENNYIWYRKYKSGWLESGMLSHVNPINEQSVVFQFPIAYATPPTLVVQITKMSESTPSGDAVYSYTVASNITVSSFTMIPSSWGTSWFACGVAAV